MSAWDRLERTDYVRIRKRVMLPEGETPNMLRNVRVRCAPSEKPALSAAAVSERPRAISATARCKRVQSTKRRTARPVSCRNSAARRLGESPTAAARSAAMIRPEPAWESIQAIAAATRASSTGTLRSAIPSA